MSLNEFKEQIEIFCYVFDGHDVMDLKSDLDLFQENVKYFNLIQKAEYQEQVKTLQRSGPYSFGDNSNIKTRQLQDKLGSPKSLLTIG